MQSLKSVKLQLAQVGYRGRVLGRGEVIELPNILRTDEKLIGAVFGLHTSGPALLAATNQRLLLIIKRFYHSRCDDIPYHVIGEIEDVHGMLTCRVKVDYRGGQVILKGVPKTRAALFVNILEKKVEAERRAKT